MIPFADSIKKCSDCRYHKSNTYHDLMWCRDCNSQHNHFKSKDKKCPNCNSIYNGVECIKCSFDASEIDIY